MRNHLSEAPATQQGVAERQVSNPRAAVQPNPAILHLKDVLATLDIEIARGTKTNQPPAVFGAPVFGMRSKLGAVLAQIEFEESIIDATVQKMKAETVIEHDQGYAAQGNVADANHQLTLTAQAGFICNCAAHLAWGSCSHSRFENQKAGVR